MDGNHQKRIDERSAAVLLGLRIAELRRLSRLSSLGQIEKNDPSAPMAFTYEELRRLCLLVSPSMD